MEQHTQPVITEAGDTSLAILRPFDIQKEELQKVVNDYKNLVVTEDTYEESVKARRVLWDHILKIEKILKENKSILNGIKGTQEDKADELISIVSPTKEKIDAGIKAIEQKKKDEKERKEKEAMIKIQHRTNMLYELGMKVSGSTYSLGEHSIEAVQVKVFTDSEFDGFIADVKIASAAIEAKKIEEENQRKAQEELLEKQRKDQEAERNRLEGIAFAQKQREQQLQEKEEAIKKEARDKQLLAEKELSEKEEALRKQQEELINAIRKQRHAQLIALGLVEQYDAYVFHGITIAMIDLINLDDTKWNFLIDKIIPVIKQEKEKAEEKRLSDIKAEQDKKEAELKQAEEKKKALQPDKEKLSRLFTQFTNIEFPECKTNEACEVVNEVGRKTDDIKKYLANTLNSL